MIRALFIIFIFTLSSCKKMTGSGGGGGSLGEVPTAGQVAEWMRNQTNSPNGCGDIQPPPPGTPPKIMPQSNGPWKEKWSHAIMDSLDHPHLNDLINGKLRINAGDLSEINCPYFNEATPEQKKQFWVLFMASIAVPESHFHETKVDPDFDNSNSTGLLQIDEKTASRHGCYSRINYGKPKSNYGPTALDHIKMTTDESSRAGGSQGSDRMKVGSMNVACGLYVIRNQLMGGYIPSDGVSYSKWSGLKGRLITNGHGGPFYWSVLNTAKQETVKNHFKVYSHHMLPFCNKITSHEKKRNEDLPEDLQNSVDRQNAGENTSLSRNCSEIPNESINRTPKTQQADVDRVLGDQARDSKAQSK